MNPKYTILGINAYHPDSSACIMRDGQLIAAVEEERFTRIKHFAGFPTESIKYCLKEADTSIKEVDYITIPRQPQARLFKKIFYGIKMPALTKRRLFAWKKTFGIKKKLSRIFSLDEEEIKAQIISVEHHRAHLASSFFVSGFDKAFLFSADALGDFASTMWGIGQGNKIKLLGEVTFPHSLGFFYTAITQYLGFLSFGDEYKVMGLAAYGEPAFEDEFKKIVKIRGKRFELTLKYFLHHKKFIDMNFLDEYPTVDIMFSPYLERRLGKRRLPDEPIEKQHQDIAASLQKRLEEILFFLLNSLRTNHSKLCLSGGVAFNCVVNGKIFANTTFREVYIPPAPGDAGLAIGAAYYLWTHILNQPRTFVMKHAYWGPEFGEEEIGKALSAKSKELEEKGCVIEKAIDEHELCRRTAQHLAEGKVVGWFQGRMEFGPRALGNRSILVDPRRPEMKDILNARIKKREKFRPFAPSILLERVNEYFEIGYPDPFMIKAYPIKKDKRQIIPAVTHIDGTGRLQTVNKEENPLYWQLIREFEKITSVPVILNTSFNENEPIVCNPTETLNCFLRTKMDVLVLKNYLIHK